jgi:hypothetical protein
MSAGQQTGILKRTRICAGQNELKKDIQAGQKQLGKGLKSKKSDIKAAQTESEETTDMPDRQLKAIMAMVKSRPRIFESLLVSCS